MKTDERARTVDLIQVRPDVWFDLVELYHDYREINFPRGHIGNRFLTAMSKSLLTRSIEEK